MRNELQSQLITAMKAKDRLRSDVIRSLISEIKYAEIEKAKDPLPTEECLAIVQREIKKRKEELEFNEKSGRTELIEKTAAELKILAEFMPTQLSQEEVTQKLNEFKNSNPAAAMGLAMKFLKDNFAGKYDAKAASELAKKSFPEVSKLLDRYQGNFTAGLIMKKFFCLILHTGLFTALFLSIFTGHAYSEASQKIKVGMLLTLSGSFATAGEDCRKGILAATAAVGKEDRLDLIFADSKNEPMTAIGELNRLVQSEKALAIYTHRSSIGMALNPLSARLSVPFLGAVGHKDFAANNPFAIQIWPKSDEEGRFLAGEMIKEGNKKSALIYTEDEWTSSVSAGFREKFTKLGGELLYDQAILPGDTDFRAQLLRIKAKAPQAVYMNVLLPHIAPLIRQAREAGLKSVLYFNFYVAKKDVLDAVGPEALEGVRFNEPDTNLPKLKSLLGLAPEQSPAGLTLASYLATMLLEQAATSSADINSTQDLQKALLNQHEVRTPDSVYKIIDRVVQIPMTLKTIRNGKAG